MSASAPLPKDHPAIIAWEAYKATDEYANTKRWATEASHTEGSLWAAFYEGFAALRPKEAGQAVEPAAVDDIAEILFNQRETQHVWEDAISAEADPESDAGTLASICRDDARAVLLRLYASPPPASPAVTVGVKPALIEQWLIAAYARGVEWNEENPLDREYRFKAAGDWADKALNDPESELCRALTSPAGETAQVEAIPVGWFLVPEVPTDDQMQAGLYQSSHDATYAGVCQSYMDMVRTPVEAPSLSASSLSAKESPEQLRERCAALCDAEADKRYEQARKASAGDTSWGIDTAASAIAQDNKAITARALAAAIRALPLSTGGGQ